MLALSLALLLSASPEESCTTTCQERGALCRAGCRNHPLEDACFAACRNELLDCTTDCRLGETTQVRGAPASRLSKWEKACNGGAGKACVSAGLAYMVGSEASKDEDRAAQLFAGACRYNEPDGCAILGDLQVKGRGVMAERPKGLANMERSCERGSSLGCTLLGLTWRDGHAGQKDPAKAKKLFQGACQADFAPACRNLALLYAEQGPDFDVDKASASHEKACQLDDPSSCAYLCLLALRADGGPNDPLMSLGACTRACDVQVMPACTVQATLLLRGAAGKPNPKRARELLEAACDGTDPWACWLLGEGTQSGAHGWKRSEKAAVPYFERAALIVERGCKDKKGRACLVQALLAAEGKAAAEVTAAHRAELKNACGAQELSGCAALGQVLLLGKGGDEDMAGARAAWETGCTAKQALSCRRLGHLLARPAEAGAAGDADPDAVAGTMALESGCALDDGPSCFELAKVTAPTKDAAKRIRELKKKACRLGVKDACR